MPHDPGTHPVAGRDYPRTWSQFLRWFPDQGACVAYLEGLRWPEGFACPSCAVTGEAWRASRGRLVCRACGHQTTPTAGTIFEKTRIPLTTWFAAIWAMVRPGRDRLRGIVEVDEAYIGGTEKGVRGRQTQRKAIVAIAVEVHDPKGFGRVRLQQVADVSSPSLTGFILEAVEPGSVVHTDGWKGYDDLPSKGYVRHRTVLAATGDPAHVAMPAVHRVASLLKRWLLGTHQGAVRPVHLDDYLDEFTFRFNRRSSQSRGLLFYRLLEIAVVVDPAPYETIVRGRRKRKKR